METCIRGFSFMTESKVDLVDLQYIEGGELERAWRSTRRERMKQQEQKIWDKFVKEQDIVKGVCNDDRYQFLDQLPESCLKEIMERELQKMTQENAEEEAKTKVQELAQYGNGDSSAGDDSQHTCVVTFADDIDKEDCDIFHIFDDEQSGAEDEVLNDSISPTTVRERKTDAAANNQSPERHISLEKSTRAEDEVLNDSISPTTVRERETDAAATNQSPERHISLEKSTSKSSENVTNVIESSIYCAKVKDLRMKITEELLALMTSLDRRDILSAEPDDIARMIKRSAEFCTRFNRIHMYQLQRQIHDIKRKNSVSLPFAKHTQFQSQMVRIVSLHQNLLQAFQVFHKSLAQTCCVRESAGALGSLLAAARDSTHMCLSVPPPKDFTAALDLYNDDMLSTCDKVDDFINEYAIRCEEFLNSFETMNMAHTRKLTKNKVKKRSFGLWNRNTVKTDTEARLSMYSLDTLRLNLNAKSSSSKDNQVSSSVKMRGGNGTNNNLKRGQSDKNSDTSKSQRRSRRPLMRDPHAGRPRAPRPTRDTDIRTMVEGVETCASSHISREDSPYAARRSNTATPRRTLHACHAPHASDAHASLPHTSRAPASHTPRARNTQDLAHKKQQPSPSHTKHSEEPSPTKEKPCSQSPKSTIVLKESQNYTRIEQESADMTQMTPVCKIQCAMKKVLEIDEGAKYGECSRVEVSPKKTLLPIKNREDTNEKKKATTESTNMKPVCKIQCAVKKEVDETVNHRKSPRRPVSPTRNREPVIEKKARERETERSKMSNMSPDRCQVTRLLKQLCSGDASGTERVTGAKNAQLLYVSGSSPRQPSTPQLLRILEETIQKKIPKPLFQKPIHGPDRYRLVFNIAEKTADTLFQYRTKFVQHMLTSAMYANSTVGKPWEMISSVSEQIIDELLLGCVKEMELRDLIQKLYKKETS